MDILAKNSVGINIGCLLSCIFTLLIIIFAICHKKEKNRMNLKFTHYLGFLLAAITFELIAHIIAYTEISVNIHFFVNVLVYGCGALSLAYFYAYILRIVEIRKQKQFSFLRRSWAFFYAMICTGLFASSWWNHFFFYVTEDGIYKTTEYTQYAAIVHFPLTLSYLVLIILYRNWLKRREIILVCLNLLTYYVFGRYDMVNVTDFSFLGLTLFCLLFYVWVELEQEKLLEKKEKELIDSELKALRMQLNPHFIYNTIASIDVLCMKDPKEARHLLRSLSKHLRNSYLDHDEMTCTLQEELDSLKYYIEIEKTRFPGVNVEYQVEHEQIMIPSRILQPIVENAIEHGICQSLTHKGTITISTQETQDCYVIKVKDDGAGFDMLQESTMGGREKTGLLNVKKRLELISQGTLLITSVKGIGTEVELKIPKQEPSGNEV